MLGIGAAGGWGQYGAAYMSMRYASAYGARRASSSGISPVTPVTRAPSVEPKEQPRRVMFSEPRQGSQVLDQKNGDLSIPFMREGADPVEMAVRGRIQYLEGELSRPEDEAYIPPALKGKEQLPDSEESLKGISEDILGLSDDALKSEEGAENAKSPQEVMEDAECQTCKERKYQDGSDDPGVSFKNPTNIAPEAAASAVRGHENEHVVRERAEAEREGRRVVSQSVTLHTDICPECGDVYISGGTTRTTTKSDPKPAEPVEGKSEKAQDTLAS